MIKDLIECLVCLLLAITWLGIAASINFMIPWWIIIPLLILVIYITEIIQTNVYFQNMNDNTRFHSLLVIPWSTLLVALLLSGTGILALLVLSVALVVAACIWEFFTRRLAKSTCTVTH